MLILLCAYCISDITATDDPPRPTFDSVLSRDMAGYMPARADFMEVSGYMRPLLYHLCANIACQNEMATRWLMIKCYSNVIHALNCWLPSFVFTHELFIIDQLHVNVNLKQTNI